ncbi:MNIO family bufferin maturase [Reyranella sp.]|uniref:MNIO family bufferin maturase n=1 Tax=Reyranella sp. TaxID=1929291 RepID=UPI0040356F87
MKPVAGIGLRSPHLAEIARDRPATGFLEIHAENYLAHSPALGTAERLREDYEFSIHAVGLSLGSVDGVDEAHLDRVATLIRRLEPALVSDHLAWSGLAGRYFNDLLPLPYTEEALGVVERNVHRLQERLGRQVLVENPSCYLAFAHSTLSEPEFLAELVRRTGCGVLLDANNIVVTAHNLRLDPGAWLDGLPVSAVGQYHLAGHAVNDADGEPVLIDDHGSRVGEGVWALFDEIVRRYGPRPTLVEWDTDLPALAVLLDEARRAGRALGIVADARAA